MPVRNELLDEIKDVLGSSITPSFTVSSAADDLFEAFIFSIIIQAARAEGATISYQCINGGSPNPFVFRTSPGYIGSNRRNYGYAVINFSGCPLLEAHVGIRVAGQSNVLHECDVSVLLKDEADLCRRGLGRVAPRSSKVIIAAEAKHYTVGLPLHLGRAFLGLARDLSVNDLYFITNREANFIEKLLSQRLTKHPCKWQ
ncbi:hypothetical protein [Desulfitobacterium chlororespirans]|uniref:Uncharacterized protein n=1 Tax=Desulfitobacterium chlororespirans DSM 11544 TaxID=1121395 RepID=A0A1M7UNC8_9FIRM|nr:hypothetical protein [Desulfitobacterium chlororespirans]SHN84523.1 hypothetical protein SAMN02745215_04259 [Desulfitobacterium chlororespirans DSM 11544]